MKDRLFKLILWVTGVVSLASLGAILLFLSPYSGGPGVYFLFSITLVLVLGIILTALGMLMRRRFITAKNHKRIVAIALREGFILSVLLVCLLWFLRFDILTLWSASAAVLVMVAVEYYFLTHFHARA